MDESTPEVNKYGAKFWIKFDFRSFICEWGTSGANYGIDPITVIHDLVLVQTCMARDDNSLKSSEYVISRSTGRRYNEVVQEFLKQKLGKSEPQLSNNSIPPSQILTAHSDKAGPEEGSYVSWECPDTPGTKRPISIPDGNEDLDNTPGSHTKPKAKPSSSSSKYSSSVSGMDSFRTADPFSPLAKNVVRLSDSSMQSPWNDSNPFSSGSRGSKSSSKHGGLDEISSGSPASRPGSDVITVFPKNSVFPSPDRSMHGPPLTTFTCADDANDSFTSIPIQTPTPKEDHDFSKGKCPPVNPHTPSIRLTSVKGSSLSLFDGSLIKESTTPSKQQPTLAPVIDQSDLLSPSLGPLTEMTKSRHPLGKEGYGQESPDSLEFSVSSVESRKSEGKSLGACSHASQITPSDHSQDESSKPNQSEDLRSFYTPDTTSVHPRALDFENTSGRSESLKKFRTPQDDSIASYPPEEMDVKTYTINISTPPRSAASSRSSVHRREIPLWQVSDDMDLYQNEITRRKNIRRRLRCGWCLIVFGTLLLITCIIAILAIEIPAHREEVSKVIPNSQALVNSDDGFEGKV
ncbi:hypothetical protein SK128_009306 [Halocaridina rubra]|uniref:Uncharacterized protein n=1 Tax=Halocaridina rubra TaxID=373956 RepID=A0AAN9ADH1_HALRR